MKAAPNVDSWLALNSLETKRIRMLDLPTPDHLNINKGSGEKYIPESPKRTTLTSFDLFCIIQNIF